MEAEVEIPNVLRHGLDEASFVEGQSIMPKTVEAQFEVCQHFPLLTVKNKFLEVVPCEKRADSRPLKIGVVFCGRQAPGGHNIIDGLLQALKSRPGSQLVGFLGGTLGMFEKRHVVITEENFKPYRNQGGWEAIGRSVD